MYGEPCSRKNGIQQQGSTYFLKSSSSAEEKEMTPLKRVHEFFSYLKIFAIFRSDLM